MWHAAPSLAHRLRNYQVLTPAGAYVPAAMSGMADLTFKMKKVDPDVGPGELQLPRTVRGYLALVVYACPLPNPGGLLLLYALGGTSRVCQAGRQKFSLPSAHLLHMISTVRNFAQMFGC